MLKINVLHQLTVEEVVDEIVEVVVDNHHDMIHLINRIHHYDEYKHKIKNKLLQTNFMFLLYNLTQRSERSERSGVRLYTDHFKKIPSVRPSVRPFVPFFLQNHWTDLYETLHAYSYTPKKRFERS